MAQSLTFYVDLCQSGRAPAGAPRGNTCPAFYRRVRAHHVVPPVEIQASGFACRASMFVLWPGLRRYIRRAGARQINPEDRIVRHSHTFFEFFDSHGERPPWYLIVV